MTQKKNIYDHFHPDERSFVVKVEEWIERCSERHEWKRTDYLDPRQAEIVRALASRNGEVAIRFDGGYEEAERQRAVIAPDYAVLDDEPMGVQAIAVTADSQGHLDLDHGDYLGALLGLGVKRELIGDIHVHEDGCHCMVTEEIADYVNIHLRQVHRVHVLTELIPLSALRVVKSKLEEMSLSVASLRLDGVASDVYRLSRAKIVDPIRAGRCRVNWKAEENPSALLKAGDVVSMKGLGRFKVLEVEGVTKKGRFRVSIGKYI
ncbi:RNA-binding S4 domain protein [Paenibacillus curdlanolyticus YK9]|uniref:RNA-binding S4 domain protein n=1 Tax=Paenibacillus curdlanolyticus YK9 TaxID=717606 RepID=E0I3H4_9BACL|nr:YlmH/Sll1252 family protein [Paenibacillus curdlanolyticus]EFM12838.1 RNA-binding S4 domain protein [Paenibacillus curdlanolyticus YK9]